jgi:CRP/FNR family transcriptional regulator, transcriptional activator FtrB
MRESEIEEVRLLPIFQGMAREQFVGLMKGAFLQRFPARVGLIAEHDRPDFLHVILEGAIELYSEHGARAATLAIRRPFDTFILAAVVGDLPYLASGRTIEPSRILMLPAEAVRAAFDRDGAFARAIVRELSHSFRGVMKELKGHKLRTGAERLANWILVQDARHGATGRFRLPHGKRTLAAHLGVTPETLSRTIAQIADHGASFGRRDVTIVDRDRLTSFAQPSRSLDDVSY